MSKSKCDHYTMIANWRNYCLTRTISLVAKTKPFPVMKYVPTDLIYFDSKIKHTLVSNYRFIKAFFKRERKLWERNFYICDQSIDFDENRRLLCLMIWWWWSKIRMCKIVKVQKVVKEMWGCWALPGRTSSFSSKGPVFNLHEALSGENYKSLLSFQVTKL